VCLIAVQEPLDSQVFAPICTKNNSKGKRRNKWFGIVVGIRDLGVGDDVVVVVAEAAGTPHELAEDDVAERIAAPPLRVASGHPLRLLPALLLHRVREAPGLRRGRRRRRQQQLVQVGGGCGSGGRSGGKRA